MAAASAPALGRRELAVLFLALIAQAVGQSLVFAVLAPLGREVELNELQITSIIAASSIVFGLSAPAWGRVSDRLGRKPVIIIGLVGYTVGTLLFTSLLFLGLAGVIGATLLYPLALLARCGQSTIMSASTPASTAYAADRTDRQRRTRTMARLGAANSVGMILGPAVSGALATFGLLAPLYFAALLAAAAAILVWRLLPPNPAAERRPVARRRRLRYSDPRLRRFVITAGGLFTGYAAIQQTLGFQLQDRLQLSGIATAQTAGLALMVAAVFSVGVQVTVMQRLRVRPGLLVRIGLGVATLGAAVVAAATSLQLLALGMACLGTAIGLCVPACTAGASLAVGTDEQGAAAGVIGACPAIGFASGPLIGGALYRLHGSLPALFSAAVFLAVLLYLLRSRPA